MTPMPTDPMAASLKNLIAIQRLGNGLSADARRLIEELFADIVAQLARIDPTSPKAEKWRLARMKKLMGEVQGLTREQFDAIHKEIRASLAEIGVQQGEWAVRQLENVLAGATVAVDLKPGSIGLNMMKSIIDTDPVQGAVMRDWWRKQADNVAWRFRKQIQIGMAQGETIGDLVRRIRGRYAGKRGQYIGGVMQVSTRDAESLVLTAVNQISNTAHFETFRAQSDITTEYEYVATLDSRTSEICMALDGQTWAYDDPDGKRPPQHYRCRSVIAPVIDWEGLGLPEPPVGTKATESGPVKASTSYEGWLKDQPKGVQNEILGPSRAQLFRDGKISLRDLVRSDNSIVTVAELRTGA